MKKLFLMAALSTALLAACGGGGGGEVVQAAPSDLVLSINPQSGDTITAALVQEPFVFPAGVPDLGTTSATTLTFKPATNPGGVPDTTAPGGDPGFEIKDATGATATGTVEYGSCIFVVRNSTFPAGHRLANGARVTVNPCQVRLSTQGAPADSVARQRAAVFILGTAASNGESVTVHINNGGVVTINGVASGTVTLVPVTGA